MTIKNTAAQLRRKHHKKGFTLTEIAIVLGIMGLILGAIWTAASSVYSNQRVNHATTAVLQIVAGVRNLYSTSSTTGYTTAGQDMTGDLINAGVVPGDMISGVTLTGPFPGGATSILATGDGAGFVINMTAVPKNNCIAMLLAIGGSSRDPGLFADSANVTATNIAAATTGSPLTSPVTAAQANASATGTAPSEYGGCTANPSTVQFGFTLK